ncbi:response regulator transcription factor [Albidovulum sediminicola]|uniref:Response regulator n=1 Tax=Albidovulum sediminicola TaxID=2984331 RepID=A0ABT2Z6S9_9RHOB|nr:response regulator [Defluviimonas sp. WL0075]MCV2866843.1 response regulator [Defluviimonas sp. WL0075]
MRVLIVESNASLRWLWKRHLQRRGFAVELAGSQEEAAGAISDREHDVIVLDAVLEDGSALAVADYASYRRPDARVIFVTSSSFFSDGSIFALAANACAVLPCGTSPDDLASVVEHYGARG